MSWDDTWSVGCHLASRTTHFLGQSDQQDYGLEAQLVGEFARVAVRLNAFGWAGDLDHWRGLRLHLERRVGHFVSLRGGVSVWDLSDPARQVLQGLTTSEFVGVGWGIARGTNLSAELQHGYSKVGDHRWRFMTSLGVEVWR